MTSAIRLSMNQASLILMHPMTVVPRPLRLLLAIAILVIASTVCVSQSAQITLYGEDEGLNRMSINDITRGPLGYIWMATEKGLVRFDGSNFVEFNPEQGSLKNPDVLRIHRNGHILYAVYRDSGLFRFDTKNYGAILITRNPVSDVVTMGDSLLFYTTKIGELVVMRSGKEIKRRVFRNHGESLIRMHGRKLVANFMNRGMYVIDPGTLNIERKLPFASSGSFECFESIGDTLLYIANDRLFQISDGSGFNGGIVPFNSPIKEVTGFKALSSTTRFYIERRKSLYYSNEKGTRAIPITAIKNIELKNLLCIDPNNLFIGTNQGLLKINFKPTVIRNIDDNAFASPDRLRIRRKILETPAGKLILTGHPYNYLADSDSTFKLISDSTMSAFDAALIGDHVFVASEDRGLKRINLRDRTTESISLENGETDGNYTAIEADLLSGNIYIGGIGTLIRYNTRSQKKQFFNLPDRSARIRYIFRDTLFDRLWLGTENGLYYTRSDPDGRSLFPVFNRLDGKIIGDLRPRKGSTELWVGHENGVEVIDLKSLNIIHRVPSENFYNTRVTGILEDKKGRMWFSTYYGLVGYDHRTGEFVRLNKKNNLINLEYNYKSCITRKNGELVFGGLNGYDIIQPENYVFTRIEKTGIISGVQVFSEEDTSMHMLGADDLNRIVFNTDEEHLRIYLSTKNLVKADQYNYQFKLDDGAWTKTNRQSHIKIIKLDPGTYKLQMRAFNEYGVPVQFDTVTLIAKQSFIKSRYFLGFLTLLSFASMFSVLTTVRRSRKKERELKESIAMDLHDEVGTILTRTLYIQNQTKPDDPLRNSIPKYLNEALFSLRVYIQTMHKDLIGIRGLRDEIQDTLTATFATTKIRLEFQCNCKEEIKLDSKLYRDIKLCIYEVANNILKHSGASICKVELTLNRTILSIHIEDDGILNDTLQLENKGNGINNLRKRVERNSGTIAFTIPDSGRGLITNISFNLKS